MQACFRKAYFLPRGGKRGFLPKMRREKISKSHVRICQKKVYGVIGFNRFIVLSDLLPAGMFLSLSENPNYKKIEDLMNSVNSEEGLYCTSLRECSSGQQFHALLFFYIAKKHLIHYKTTTLYYLERSLTK